MSDPIIKIQNMNKWFGDFQVLKNINLEVEANKKIVVCGPSGSGKSTLIRCINRLEEHQEGDIIVDGNELSEKNIGAVNGIFNKDSDVNFGNLLTKNQKIKGIGLQNVHNSENIGINYINTGGGNSFNKEQFYKYKTELNFSRFYGFDNYPSYFVRITI